MERPVFNDEEEDKNTKKQEENIDYFEDIKTRAYIRDNKIVLE